MSIVHEALKKAQQKLETTALGHEKKELSFTETTHSWLQKIASVGIIALAGVALFSAVLFAPQRTPSLSRVLTTLSHTSGITTVTSLRPNKLPSSAEGARDALEKGIALYGAGDLTKAEEQFTRAIALDPMLAEAHNGLGLIYKIRGDWDQAGQHYQLALGAKPDYAEVLNNLAVLYDQRGMAKESQRLYDQVLTLEPHYAEAHLNYAISLEKSGFIKEAKREYQLFISSASSEQQDLVRTVHNRLEALQ